MSPKKVTWGFFLFYKQEKVPKKKAHINFVMVKSVEIDLKLHYITLTYCEIGTRIDSFRKILKNCFNMTNFLVRNTSKCL